jgi:hypothetical protein
MKLSKKKKHNHFLAVWDMLGLEALFDVGAHYREVEEWEKRNIWSVLKEEDREPKPLGPPLTLLLIRARINAQRKYEIYEFTSELSYNEVFRLFESDPNTIAQSIRDVGHKIYSDRENSKNQVIF